MAKNTEVNAKPASKRARTKWNKENQSTVCATVSKSEKAQVLRHIESINNKHHTNLSVNSYVRGLLQKDGAMLTLGDIPDELF